MASSVYSARFVNAPSFSGGPTLQYVVPAGFRAVLKSISIVHGDVVASGLDAWLQDEYLCKLCRSVINITLSPQPNWYGGTDLYYGSWVLDEGDELYAQTAAGTVDIYASGYLLTLP